MKNIRRGVIRALDTLGIKQPVKSGLNRVLAAGGLPAVGEPEVFRDLQRLARGPRPRPAQQRGRILIFTMRGWTRHVALETLLGEAAAQRGMEPVFYTCGGPLPLCGITNFRAPDPTPCADCHGYVARFFDALGFPVTTLDDLVGEAERRQIEARIAGVPDEALERFENDGLPLGRMVRTSVLWFLLRGTPPDNETWHSVNRRFIAAGLMVQAAVERLLEETRPDRVLCLNGLFFAERILRAAADRRGIPVTTYEQGFKPGSWVFRHDEIACEYRIAGDFVARADTPLPAPERARVEGYLQDRARGKVDAGQYWPRIEQRRRAVERELGLDPSRPVVSVFTNITWDSAVQEHDVAFEDMFDWLGSTVRFFVARPDAQLVIRIHPAEVRLEGQQTGEGVVEALEQRLGKLPDCIRIVPAESRLSSYTLGGMSRMVLVYTSTMGLEMAAQGIPVVVAGQTHYTGLDFTTEVEDRAEYEGLLARLLDGPPPAPDVERALRYAHFFFFRFMVSLGITREIEGQQVRIPLDSLADLAPGRDPALDVVMNGLIEGRPIFVDPPPLEGRGQDADR